MPYSRTNRRHGMPHQRQTRIRHHPGKQRKRYHRNHRTRNPRTRRQPTHTTLSRKRTHNTSRICSRNLHPRTLSRPTNLRNAHGRNLPHHVRHPPNTPNRNQTRPRRRHNGHSSIGSQTRKTGNNRRTASTRHIPATQHTDRLLISIIPKRNNTNRIMSRIRRR